MEIKSSIVRPAGSTRPSQSALGPCEWFRFRHEKMRLTLDHAFPNYSKAGGIHEIARRARKGYPSPKRSEPTAFRRGCHDQTY